MIGPAVGSAPGWPLVLYFHHVHPRLDHYTSLTPEQFRRGLDVVLSCFGPAVEPTAVGPGFRPPDHPSVLITFDDGYRDTADTAAGVLAEFDVRMLLFCVTDRLDTARGEPGTPVREEYLSWDLAADLAGAGHVLSAHTRSHPKLTELNPVAATGEVTGSLAAVAEHTGTRPRTFAYPYGLVSAERTVPADVLAFGTVKAAPASWAVEPHRIRRTYLPTGAGERWPELVMGWRQQWFG